LHAVILGSFAWSGAACGVVKSSVDSPNVVIAMIASRGRLIGVRGTVGVRQGHKTGRICT